MVSSAGELLVQVLTIAVVPEPCTHLNQIDPFPVAPGSGAYSGQEPTSPGRLGQSVLAVQGLPALDPPMHVPEPVWQQKPKSLGGSVARVLLVALLPGTGITSAPPSPR